MINNRFLIISLFAALTQLSCQNEKKEPPKNEITRKQTHHTKASQPQESNLTHSNKKNTKDIIVLSKKHHVNSISCDLDGDHVPDTVNLVQNTENKKYGLEILFGNKKVEYLGMGKDILGQGFDDLDWVGVFEKAPKGEIYWNNVNDEGEIIGEENVPESDKIKLPNDGIFIHQEEACGGGVIYWKNGKPEWIQQE
ncbi:hypothetical protein IW15_20245 [Chryseobacterium soli]|uniref:Uncharacterized protein n=1 Tax=Chryseobacterium soli TaxID=445961 RepID=A0A086A100_9FLAO|nr:hypothetical protein [Chryseobacterium soli]KFF10364.1 hypothetical protein IW15_20245 [Chryseobacterium soli]